MSNIPEARRILQQALGKDFPSTTELRSHMREALGLLDRKKPAFISRSAAKALTFRQKHKARQLRSTGMSLHDIAVRMGTNIGRVSEAINEFYTEE